MRKTTAIIIRDLVNEFNLFYSEMVKNVLEVGLNWSFEVCETLHLREDSIIDIDGVEYKVLSVVGNVITVSGSIEPAGVMTYPTVYFYNGTPIMVGNELDRVLDAEQKTPMIYLYEPITDTFNDDEEQQIERQSDVRLFFLDQSNFADWDTDQHYSGAVNPMFQLCEGFVQFLLQNQEIGEIDSHSVTYIPNFSIVRNQNGTTKKIFNDDLSGVELRISIPIFKTLACKC